MKTVFDTKGGDKGCEAVVLGALNSLKNHEDLSAVFVGDENEINPLLPSELIECGRVSTVHAPGVVTGEDRPTDAIVFL